MGEKVTRPVAVWDEYPRRLERQEVESTPTPGLYVTEHPEVDGWVLVIECGRYVNRLRWKFPPTPQAAAVALGETDIDWTLPYDELTAASPNTAIQINAALNPLGDRRYPIEPREPQPSNKYRRSQARKNASDQQGPSIE